MALLQEEALEGVKQSNYRKTEPGIMVRTGRMVPNIGTTLQTKAVVQQSEDRRGTEAARARDDKMAALRAYIRSKGLCFTCGERTISVLVPFSYM